MGRSVFDILTALFVALLLMVGCLIEVSAKLPQGAFFMVFADVFCLVAVIWAALKGLRAAVFLIFNVMYFIFLLGGVTFNVLQGASFESYFSSSPTAGAQACFLAMLSLGVIDCIYISAFGSLRNAEHKLDDSVAKKVKIEIRPTAFLRGLVLLVLIVSGLVKLYMAYETMGHSQANGYLALYRSYSSSLPQLVQYFSSVFYLVLFLYLASNPGKRGTLFSFCLTAVIEVFVVQAGDRGEAMCTLVAIIVFMIWRSRWGFKSLRWTKAKTAAVILLAPFTLAFLQSIKYTRMGEAFNLSVGDAAIEFFDSQGVSLNVIGKAIDYQAALESFANVPFTIGHLLNYLTQNAVSTGVFGFEKLAGNTLEMAHSGYSMGSTLAYLWYPTSYLNGVGCGTSYIAEAYIDFSYFGVAVASTLIAMLLLWLDRDSEGGWIQTALKLCIVKIVAELPRGALFKWFTATFAVQNILFLLLLIIIAVWQMRRHTAYGHSGTTAKNRGITRFEFRGGGGFHGERAR